MKIVISRLPEASVYQLDLPGVVYTCNVPKWSSSEHQKVAFLTHPDRPKVVSALRVVVPALLALNDHFERQRDLADECQKRLANQHSQLVRQQESRRLYSISTLRVCVYAPFYRTLFKEDIISLRLRSVC